MAWGRCRNPKLTKDRVHSFEFQCYPCFSIALRFSAIPISDVVDCIDLHLSPQRCDIARNSFAAVAMSDLIVM